MNIAHAGGKGTRPEHAMIAYETALSQGADVLELDVHSTSDGVLLHDTTIAPLKLRAAGKRFKPMT